LGLALFDAEGVCVHANQAFSRIVACGIEDASERGLGSLVACCFGRDAADQATRALRDTLADGAPVRFQEWYASPEDAMPGLFVEAELCRLDDPGGGPPVVLLTLRDVTRQALDRRALEESRRLAIALTRLSTVIGFTMDVDDILREVVVEAAEAIGCDSAAIDVHDGEKWVVRHVHNLPTTLIGTTFGFEEASFADLAINTRRAVAVDDAFTDPLADHEVHRDSGVRSVLVVPIATRGEVTGLIFFNYHFEPHAFGTAAIDFANRLATIVSLAVDNARLYIADRETTDALQSALIGRTRIVPGVAFGHLYRSATRHARVGGDFYEVFPLDDRRVGVLIGDVSGKGIEAAALMAMVKNTVKVHAEELRSPAAALVKTNEVVYRESSSESFVTVFFGVLEVETGRFPYCLAGHPPAILRRRSGHTVLLRDACPLLGAYAGMVYEDRETYLEPGDVLVLYTDGVTEARRDGVQYGELRLAGFVSSLPDVDPHELPELIFEEVFNHARGDMADDMAVLALTPTGLVEHGQGRLAI
jgi:PAS domain-containing protein